MSRIHTPQGDGWGIGYPEGLREQLNKLLDMSQWLSEHFIFGDDRGLDYYLCGYAARAFQLFYSTIALSRIGCIEEASALLRISYECALVVRFLTRIEESDAAGLLSSYRETWFDVMRKWEKRFNAEQAEIAKRKYAFDERKVKGGVDRILEFRKKLKMKIGGTGSVESFTQMKSHELASEFGSENLQNQYVFMYKVFSHIIHSNPTMFDWKFMPLASGQPWQIREARDRTTPTSLEYLAVDHLKETLTAISPKAGLQKDFVERFIEQVAEFIYDHERRRLDSTI